jgi:hypothetical protein
MIIMTRTAPTRTSTIRSPKCQGRPRLFPWVIASTPFPAKDRSKWLGADRGITVARPASLSDAANGHSST